MSVEEILTQVRDRLEAILKKDGYDGDGVMTYNDKITGNEYWYNAGNRSIIGPEGNLLPDDRTGSFFMGEKMA